MVWKYCPPFQSCSQAEILQGYDLNPFTSKIVQSYHCSKISTLEEIFRISARPCNILYIHCGSKLVSFGPRWHIEFRY